LAPTKDEVINDHYGWRVSETTNNFYEKTFGAVSAGFLLLSLLTF